MNYSKANSVYFPAKYIQKSENYDLILALLQSLSNPPPSPSINYNANLETLTLMFYTFILKDFLVVKF